MRPDKLIALLKRNLIKILGENRRLRQEYRNLSAEMKKFKENKTREIVELKGEHNTLQSNHDALKYEHGALVEQYKELRARRTYLSASNTINIVANNIPI